MSRASTHHQKERIPGTQRSSTDLENNGTAQEASGRATMEEDFVTKLLRNSGNPGPEQGNYKAASGNPPPPLPYHALRVPEVSGLWDSNADITVTYDTAATKGAQPRWLEDTEYAVISYSIYGCILLVLACVVTALLVVFGNS
uniref:Uncharacterized protein LOC111127073 n=1 Tax=Crassostrea virginica TaxID=6565 RepID=A0A8B8DLC4_CRAVI|nr:uncharacterized protein LOC111127073 [Crassostrea virginica]